ncbi:hypothetical protein IE81DRAFT_222819 [Ceraceosorus guamensis]|uniref:Uncharacterized protein n=1 Tax=Ceraceosorus guamensis TaxID=1522189 RepID=A0A316VRV0_9BASI|nr:hypothetical protein IE81DRAFT_222819 [Ceraceosorus guamensis]PWN40379.1 hypothetical protein IE81DRAFT_222819 [Ceraceosorus guamensis]
MNSFDAISTAFTSAPSHLPAAFTIVLATAKSQIHAARPAPPDLGADHADRCKSTLESQMPHRVGVKFSRKLALPRIL